MIVGILRKQFKAAILLVHLIDEALMGADKRNQFRQKKAAHCAQIALALEHTRKPGEIRFEPVLLCVALCRQAQIADHGVDVVFKFGDFASRFHLNGARQVALVTAVATSAIARTWFVRFAASRFTLPTRSSKFPQRLAHWPAPQDVPPRPLRALPLSPDRRRWRACPSCY